MIFLVGLGLGLLSALSYGLLDIGSVLAARFVQSTKALAWTHTLAALALSVIMLLLGLRTESLVMLLLVGAIMGLCNALGNLALYKAFAHGPVALVSPIVSAYGLVPLVLSVGLLQEALSWPQAVGAGLLLMGLLVVTTSQQPSAAAASQQQPQSTSAVVALLGGPGMLARLRQWSSARIGVLWGLVALLCFGVEIFVLARSSLAYGVVAPLWSSRLCSALLLLLMTGAWRLRSRQSGPTLPQGHRRRLGILIVAGMALADLVAAGSFAWGAHFLPTGILATLSLTYPAFPVLLGILAYRERPTVRQWSGVGVLALGVLALATTS